MEATKGGRGRALAAAVAFAMMCTGLVTLAAPAASAATGDLTYIECIRYSAVDRDGCAQIKPGLANVTEAVTSPDGRFVYVRGDVITTFARDTVSGALTWVRCHGAGDGCVDAPHHGGYRDLVISPDGLNAYATLAGRINAFSRNPSDGQLNYVGCVQNNSTANGCVSVPAMDSPTELAISDAGDRSLYVISPNTFSVVWFRRSSSNGALSFRGCIGDSSRQRIGNCGIVPGLQIPQSVEVSPDGGAVYVGTWNTLLGFDRSPTTGDLTYGECHGNAVTTVDRAAGAPSNCTPQPGLSQVIDLAFSPDGKVLHALGYVSEAVSMFLRGTTRAESSRYDCWRDVRNSLDGCSTGVIYIAEPSGLEVSPDGHTLYVTGRESDSVVPFTRNLEQAGRLYQNGCFLDAEKTGDGCTAKVQGLDGATTVAVSPDNKSVYVAARTDQALVRFARQVAPNSPPPPDFNTPDTTITSGPAKRVSKRTVRFTFTSNEAGASFRCSLDGSRFRNCASPKTYKRLSKGVHRFRVAAVDAAGNRDLSPAVAKFRVI